MSENKKAALIGCGMIADTHLTALQNAGADVIGVYDRNPGAAAAFAGARGLKVYDSLEDLLADETALVSVCTPSGTHGELAEAIMEKGKYAIVEKPMALTVPECRRIMETEQRTGRFCAPISQLRFSRVYREVKAALDEGQFGRMIVGLLSMKYYRAPSYYAGSWRGTVKMDGGGALMNQGIHGIDMMCGLLGYPVSVSGKTATLLHDIEVEDTAVASLVFPDGTLGVIDGSTAITHAKARRLELCGAKASVTIEEDAIRSAEGITLSCEEGSGYNSYSDPTAISTLLHENQFRNILAAAADEEALYYTSRDAMRTVAVITAVYESSKTGTAAVPLL
ncbi:MAG: Gfo/Idh/MocA family oxidoreductase [Clostridia bacterium]|nr:Gfo/Idh/MocA family oxidoreductase [Clostridia bacterium]